MNKTNFDKNRVFREESIDAMFRDMSIYDGMVIVNGCSPDFFPRFLSKTVSGDFYNLQKV